MPVNEHCPRGGYLYPAYRYADIPQYLQKALGRNADVVNADVVNANAVIEKHTQAANNGYRQENFLQLR
jgi:hypothetical protein